MRILRLWLTDSRVKASLLAHLRRIALTGLVLLGGLCGVQAQNACINPLFPGNFSLTKDKVCVGSPISITNVPNNLISAGYNFQYDGKSSIDKVVLSATTKTFSYTAPGSYTIIQGGSGNGSGTGTVFCKEVTVLPVDAVKFTVKACAGRRAIVVPDASTLGQYDLYEIYWGDGVRQQKTRAEMALELSHTYSTASTYTITVQGIYNPPADCRSTLTQASVTVSANAAQPIITALKTTSDKSIDLTYQASTGSSVQLYQKINGTYTATGQTGTGSGTFTIQTDAKQVQCFQVVTQDACNSTGLTSDEVCSLVLDVKAANKQNNLTWQPYAGTVSGTTQFRKYVIYRNNFPASTQTNRATGTYPDATNITCGTPYCYTLEATIAGVAQTVITSAPVCVTGINDGVPGTLGSTVVSIENNHPRLVATLPTTGVSASYTLIISRASGPSGAFQPIGTVANKNTFIDETADPSAGSYCYQIAFQSNCGLTSAPSEPVCTVFLSSKSASGVDWNPDSPFTPEKTGSYVLEVIDSVNNTRREITNIGVNTHYDLSTTDLDSQSQKYRIYAISENGTISYSNFFTFRREVKIWVPDAFTPNNDTMNETFVVKGIYVDQFRMTIYDRWGEVVYTTTDKNQGWDGKIKDQNAQAGQYMYRIEVIDLTGLKTVRTGAVLLIR